jgi:iron complex outermembrane recepter protein
VLRLDAGVSHRLASFGGGELRGRLGAGFSYLSPRPLPFGQSADPVALLDASAALGWRWLELGFEGYNLTARRYAQNEYSFVSDWGTRPVPSLVPARHIAAGPPLTALGTIAVHF